jgi:hypothetical protein
MKLTHKLPSVTQRTLIYGAPKAGKTQLAASLASDFDLLWFDLENGYATLLKLPTAQQERIELISIPDTRSFPIAIETMLKVMLGMRVEICNSHGKIGCAICKKDSLGFTAVELNSLPNSTVVVVDSLTQLTNSAIANITKNQPDDYKMEFSDWGNLKTLVEKFLSHVQAAKYNIVCISHEEEVTMEDGRSKIVPVCGSSKSSRNTAKYFDHVVYCELKNKKHIAASATTYANNILTGSRTDVRLEDTAAATLLSIFKSTPATPATPAVSNQSNGEVALTALQKLQLKRS